eukprot:CAMPEP_0115835696 /NCGR_PEP_ID=MMETSP0287-20121206/4327_1 /TAXON_ID=412157 /ORGANISM="Chrysochromulina rotalis, Strain UIO044" /LENGTH=252 /DNA_ID=CAMNT_0003289161 /DNA_START=77 /DNA_END=835 /DNA_ORIENTATION=-
MLRLRGGRPTTGQCTRKMMRDCRAYTRDTEHDGAVPLALPPFNGRRGDPMVQLSPKAFEASTPCGSLAQTKDLASILRPQRRGGLCLDDAPMPCIHEAAAAVLLAQQQPGFEGPRNSFDALEFCRTSAACRCNISTPTDQYRCHALSVVVSLSNAWEGTMVKLPDALCWDSDRAARLRHEKCAELNLERSDILSALGFPPTLDLGGMASSLDPLEGTSETVVSLSTCGVNGPLGARFELMELEAIVLGEGAN